MKSRKEEIKKLFSGHTDEELEEIEQRLIEYVSIILRIMEEKKNNPEAVKRYKRKPPTNA